MKNKFIYLLPIAALVTLFAFNACKNDDDDDHHGNEATFAITSPQEGQEFHNGEVVPNSITTARKRPRWFISMRTSKRG